MLAMARLATLITKNVQELSISSENEPAYDHPSLVCLVKARSQVGLDIGDQENLVVVRPFEFDRPNRTVSWPSFAIRVHYVEVGHVASSQVPNTDLVSLRFLTYPKPDATFSKIYASTPEASFERDTRTRGWKTQGPSVVELPLGSGLAKYTKESLERKYLTFDSVELYFPTYASSHRHGIFKLLSAYHPLSSTS
ncbi:hypothetical protein CVT26_001946 [Gymnopilus dilepis]|uniref:Uncharacterized protein n=1 Tax=Gymnopilus dilepis TaxID=231916 RepID=A0A409WE51_9AGAR|nr:hypothetical protein CVT26_001946 [Gymnopilus dilepis]